MDIFYWKSRIIGFFGGLNVGCVREIRVVYWKDWVIIIKIGKFVVGVGLF